MLEGYSEVSLLLILLGRCKIPVVDEGLYRFLMRTGGRAERDRLSHPDPLDYYRRIKFGILN